LLVFVLETVILHVKVVYFVVVYLDEAVEVQEHFVVL
jgi:hypothetical protein